MNNSVDKIRILFVIDGLEFGGGERVFVQLAAGLRDRYQVFVASMPGGRFEQQVKELGIKFYPVSMSRQLSLKPICQIKEIVRDNKIELMHSQGARADFFARLAAKMLKPKVKVVNTTAVTVESYDVGALRKVAYLFFDRFSERYVDHFIVVSEALRRTLINTHKILPDKVINIYNGIELNEYRPNGKGVGSQKSEVRREFGLTKNIPVIGAIGRMVWPKGFEYLIRSIHEIAKNYPKVKVLLVGDGSLKRNLEGLTERLDLKDRIFFTGFRSDIKNILSAVDLLVVPSLLEGFPMITLEAMAMAKPIVAANIDGITEQITDGVDGILVPPKDPADLAKAVIRVLNDKELARTMGLAARKKVEQEFSLERMVSETEKVYLSLLKAG